MSNEDEMTVMFRSPGADAKLGESGGRMRTIREILDALDDDERKKSLEDLVEIIDSRIRWLQSIRAQCEEERKSISEAIELRDTIAMFVREHPIPHLPGAGLKEIIVPALLRERRICSGPLMLRIFRAIAMALKGDLQ